jgi:protein-S-isoprenylcysteine O-methyltransferase Ste14
MFPILVFMYTRLARQEERDALAEFGDKYRHYTEKTPAFLPRWRNKSDRSPKRPAI